MFDDIRFLVVTFRNTGMVSRKNLFHERKEAQEEIIKSDRALSRLITRNVSFMGEKLHERQEKWETKA